MSIAAAIVHIGTVTMAHARDVCDCALCRLYWALTTFFGMLLPYFGDFVPLAGSLSIFPIIFSATLIMTAMVHPLHSVNWMALPTCDAAQRHCLLVGPAAVA